MALVERDEPAQERALSPHGRPTGHCLAPPRGPLRRRRLAAAGGAALLLAGAALLDAPPAWAGLAGPHPPARLGLELQPMTPPLREYFSAPRDRGVLVVRVDRERPAGRAGVRVGDVIVAIDGEAVARVRDVVEKVADAPADEALELELVRQGKRRQIEVVPEGEPRPRLGPDPWQEFGERMRRGFGEGRRALERRLRDLERRLDELERRLDSNPSTHEEHT